MVKGKEILSEIFRLIDGLTVLQATIILEEAIRLLPNASTVTMDRSERLAELQRGGK
jgi:hypothetical protein